MARCVCEREYANNEQLGREAEVSLLCFVLMQRMKRMMDQGQDKAAENRKGVVNSDETMLERRSDFHQCSSWL